GSTTPRHQRQRRDRSGDGDRSGHGWAFRRIPATRLAAVILAIVAESGRDPWGRSHGVETYTRNSLSASPPKGSACDHRIGPPALCSADAAPRRSPRRTSLATRFDPPSAYVLPRESCLLFLLRASVRDTEGLW